MLSTGHQPLTTVMISAIGCGLRLVLSIKYAHLITTHRLTAGFLLLVMLFPAFGPLALARVSPAEGMHCMRHPLVGSPAPTAAPAMHCHHMAQMAPQAPDSQAAESQVDSFRSFDCCCGQHCDCCRNSKTSEWARPAVTYLSLLSLLIEPAPTAPLAAQVSPVFAGPDSARAPPRR